MLIRSVLPLLCVPILFVACGSPPDLETPPKFPNDQNAIRSRVLSPSGSLEAITVQTTANVLTSELSEEESPEPFANVILDVLFSSEMTTKSGDVSAVGGSPTARIQHPVTVTSVSADGWTEVTVLCGDDPSNHTQADGLIDLIYTISGDLTNFTPLGVAWGVAKNCLLWDLEVPTTIDGDFSLLFDEDSSDLIYEFRGTQTSDVTQELDVAGFFSDDSAGWTLEVNGETFVVGGISDVDSGDASVFIHDCAGRWLCQQSPLACYFETANSSLIEPTCERPNVESLTW